MEAEAVTGKKEEVAAEVAAAVMEAALSQAWMVIPGVQVEEKEESPGREPNAKKAAFQKALTRASVVAEEGVNATKLIN